VSTIKAYNLDSGDTTNLVLKTNNTAALTINGSTQNITVGGGIQANGIATNIYPLVSGTAQSTTSGSNIDFTGIPSWVRRITVVFNGVTTDGTNDLIVQLGTSGGFVTTGYSSYASQFDTSPSAVSSTGGFLVLTSVTAFNAGHGSLSIYNVSGDTWVYSSTMGTSDPSVAIGGGSLTLGSTLTDVRITIAGADSFYAGNINIMYE
jgi:hypothetical protein